MDQRYRDAGQRKSLGEGPPDANGESSAPMVLYPRRWLMLAYPSSLALMSDWICFSVAPVTHVAEEEYTGLHPSLLVTLFLVTNVAVSFGEPLIVDRLGLRR